MDPKVLAKFLNRIRGNGVCNNPSHAEESYCTHCMDSAFRESVVLLLASIDEKLDGLKKA